MKRATFWMVMGAMVFGLPLIAHAGDCGKCGESKCGEAKCGRAVSACSSCEARPVSCEPCEVKCCEDRKISYCEQRTSYKLVKEKYCVPKTKCRTIKDECDPCNTQRVAVTEWDEKTRYRWVKVVKPVWKTKTIKVCTNRTIHSYDGPSVEARAKSTPKVTLASATK